MRTVSIAEAKNGLTELLYQVEQAQPVTVTRRGKPVAVLVAAAEYERLRAAAASAVDFGAWVQGWRGRLPEAFRGIGADELSRWQDF